LFSKHLLWTISDFPTTKEEILKFKCGDSLETKPIQLLVNNKPTWWNLMLCGNGDTEKSAGFVGLFVRIKNPSKAAFRVKYAFGMMVRPDVMQYGPSSTEIAEEFDEGIGENEFISHEKLFEVPINQKFVINGQIKVAFKVILIALILLILHLNFPF